MKIIYIITPGLNLPQNGVKIQGLTWGKSLIDRGHEVKFLSYWENLSWDEWDIIHVFGRGFWLENFVRRTRRLNKRIICSPIIDKHCPTWVYKILSLPSIIGNSFVMMTQPGLMRALKPYIPMMCIRTEYERRFLTKGLGYNEKKTWLVPLSVRLTDEQIDFDNLQKENFCLHVSTLYQKRKNVARLIQGAIKYNFRLVLAGTKGTPKEFAPFEKMIAGHDNITVLGRVSDQELTDLYRRAKVFALPSLNEGVGMVALEAAQFGCNIVMTNVGGPKEYYADMAYLVNPLSVDDIGENIVKAMHAPTTDRLSRHIRENYNMDAIACRLEEMYQHVMDED